MRKKEMKIQEKINFIMAQDRYYFDEKFCCDHNKVPLHELYVLSESSETSMYNARKYYFIGWTLNPAWQGHAALPDDFTADDLPAMATSVALYDIPVYGGAGSGEGEDDNPYDGEADDAAHAYADTNVYFVHEGQSGSYTARAYGVWAAKPFTLKYISAERRSNSDSDLPRVGSVVMPATAVEVTGLTYSDIRKGYRIISEKPTAEGYTFKSWKIYRGSDPDEFDLKATTRTGGYYGLNVAAGSTLWYTVFNSGNPSMTVVMVPKWKRNVHNIEYWRENYSLGTGEPVLNTDGTVKTSPITTTYRLPFESEQKVGYNIKADGESAVYHPNLELPYGKLFGGWKLVAYKEHGTDEWRPVSGEVMDAGHYENGEWVRKDIYLLDHEEAFNMPDMDLKFLAIYVDEFVHVTYKPGDGFSDAERTERNDVTDDVRYNTEHQIRYAVNGTAQGTASDCGFYPSRGYVFDKWEVSCESGRTYQYREGQKLSHLRESLVYTATWKPGTYYVNYDFDYTFNDGNKPNDIYLYTASNPSQIGGRNVLFSYGYAYQDPVAMHPAPTSYESRLGETDGGSNPHSYNASKYVFEPWVKTEPAGDLTYTDENTFSMPDETVRFLGTFSLRRYTGFRRSGGGVRCLPVERVERQDLCGDGIHRSEGLRVRRMDADSERHAFYRCVFLPHGGK